MSEPFPNDKPPSSTSSSAATAAPLVAPRRDKFAALAQHQQQAAAAVSSNEVTASATTTTSSTPRRDKHAALAARRAATSSDSELPLHPNSANELGALAQQQSLEATDSDSIAATLQTTALRRNAVWHDLDRAEASVMHLLQAARTTARQLAASISAETSTVSLTDSASDYFQALQSIHDWLAPHADLVQAYAAPQRPALMYQARVERRLAQDRRALLNTWRELEALEATTRTVTPVVAVASTNEPPVDATSSKRKRE
jgi:hypothetical protein